MSYKKAYADEGDSYHNSRGEPLSVRHALANLIMTVDMPNDVVGILVTLLVCYISWKIIKFTFRATVAILWPLIIIGLVILAIYVAADIQSCVKWESMYDCAKNYAGSKFSGLEFTSERLTRKLNAILAAAYQN